MNQEIINQKARELSRVINNVEIPSIDLSATYSFAEYDGSFRTIYNLVLMKRIKVLERGGVICGISVDSGEDSIEKDNIAGEKFSKAYSQMKAMRYIQTAMILITAGVIVDDIVEKPNVRIYLYREGKVLDDSGNVVVALTNEELSKATMDNIREMLDNAMSIKSSTKTSTSKSKPKQDLPSEVVFTRDDVVKKLYKYDDCIPTAVKKYLRETYNHYLAKDNKMKIYVDDNDSNVMSVRVSDIRWGRAK